MVDAADCGSCVNCINDNAPRDGIGYMLHADHSGSCDVRKDASSFRILAQHNYNGCGYSDNIDTLYKLCAKDCSTCQKTNNACSSPLDRASATVTCAPSACAKRGEQPGFHKLCCDGLQRLNSHCIDPKQDCTPCGHRIEANKPCCSTSGINAGGYWKCAVSAGCRSCKFDTACGNKRCINGCCI